ncbi:hypothetical protein CI610_03563 [invertebrate metagenome]|uniref:Uncharacterized protein n=1 Tax=invertebrate metagenome TaxID=1711999 RepID=A0A2H9T2U8_9ZZZZ
MGNFPENTRGRRLRYALSGPRMTYDLYYPLKMTWHL